MRNVFLTAAMTLVLLLTCVTGLAAASQLQTTIDNATVTDVTQEEPAQGPVIQCGDRGADVQRVQKLLADAGFYPGTLDGIFGNGTARAVKGFQAVYKLPVDGVVGRDTLVVMQRATAEPDRYSRSIIMTATAYTADNGCGNTTYSGHSLRRGLVAVDPRVIPLGSRLYIQGYGYAIADDVGGAIKGNRIDLAFESLGGAMQFGVRKVTVYIVD